MWIEEHKQRDGKVSYYFKYRDEQGKPKRVPVKEVPRFQSRQLAEEYLPIVESKYDARKKAREDRESWHDLYYDFENLIELFAKWRAKQSPNSYEDKINRFRNYVLHYFLNLKHAPNLEEWKHHFLDFKEWLEDEAVGVKSGKPLSYSSKNHCINELNCFLELMSLKNKCEIQPRLKAFPDDLKGSRGVEDLVSNAEYEAITSRLREGCGEEYSDGYHVLRHTGMRFNEFKGLTLEDIKKGEITDESYRKIFQGYGIHSLAFIILKCQPAKEDRLDEPFENKWGKWGIGEIAWKPLKSKKDISDKFTRYIPISDKRVFEILRKYINIQRAEYEERIHGDDQRNYPLFFDYFSDQMFRDRIKEVSRTLGLKPKTMHCLRHTRSHELAKIDRTGTMSKHILGHTSKTTERYIHMIEELAKKAREQRFSLDDWD